MKKLSFLMLGIFMSLSSFSQFSINSSDKYNWMTFDDSFKSRPEVLANSEKTLLGLSDNDNLALTKSNLDNLGFEHFTYSQNHNNVKVEGAGYKLHISSDRPMKGNGRLVYGINTASVPAISSSQAFEKALDFMNAESFYWESAEMEQLLKESLNDPEATYFPEAELVFANKNYSQNGEDYKLAWKFDINSFGEKGRKIVFVNAIGGSILYALEGHLDDASESSGNTRYAGEQSFITDSVSDGLYVLYDETRGSGIHTWNVETSTSYGDRVEFTDDDNFWDNANEQMDDAAIDAHWGMQETYDYFLNEHGRDSYNGNGGLITVYIHYDNNWFNAQWTGNGVMRFGDGANNPLTSIDVTSHEFSHGVTEYTAGLIYQNESGALNESYSDVFGTAVEFYALGDEADWLIGKENFLLRSMSDPKSFGDPDTYRGDNWNFGTSDNGGVHTNSGVQNHWYYLLSEGGSGVNDNGDAYNVVGIGMEAASAIAYRNLSVYLNQSSGYAAARMGALQSAEDIYGECSYEALQTLNAWYAVGVGDAEFFEDISVSEVISPITGCGFGDQEFLTINVLNNDSWCSDDFQDGTLIHFGYQFDDGDVVSDSMVLSSAFNVGEYLEFTFSEPVDMSNQGDHHFNIWVKSPNFSDLEPNSIVNHLVGNKVVLEDSVHIGFEDTDFAADSFSVFGGIHADARISISADNTGSRGFRMTGKGVDHENIEFVIPDNEEDNFILNPEYGAQICFCVGAAEWDYVRLVFDLKQTHSEFYMEEYGEDFPNFVSSMRIMIDGEQIGDQYHPITYNDDPFLSYSISLDNYAGSDFDLCFESKTFLSKINDPISGSKGDNTYLDNIRFNNDAALSIDEKERVDFNISPNPSSGIFNIDFNSNLSGHYFISVVDVLGREVYSNQNAVKQGERLSIDISEYPKGMYSVILRSDSDAIVKKFILE